MFNFNRISALCCAFVFGLGGTLSSRCVADDAPPPLVLSNQGMLPPAEYTQVQLNEMWPTFQHAPFESSGFNALSLPFHYQDKTDTGDAREANTFAFLLSSALDWAPSCYCSRHAYFVFAGSREAELQLAQRYDPALISKLVIGWGATHAIGGTLIKTADGFTGELEIFSSDGKVAYFQAFNEPKPYFDLLGEMAADAMKYLGDPPSDALVKHLKQPRCKDPKSLTQWGEAAFKDRAAMLKIAEQVLADDPDFAEVRAWAANQKGWDVDQPAVQAREYYRSLESYLTSEPLRTFNLRAAPALPRKNCDQWWTTVATLAPDDSPLRVLHSMIRMSQEANWNDPELDAALKSAEKFPNHYYLLSTVSNAYFLPESGRLDADMAVSMSLAATQSRFLTFDGTKSDAKSALARAMLMLGRTDIAAEVLLTEKDQLPETQTLLLMSAYSDLGQYESSLKLYEQHHDGIRQLRGAVAAEAVFAAAMLGRRDVLDQVIQRDISALEDVNCEGVAHAYQDVLAGKTVDLPHLHATCTDPVSGDEFLFLAAQLELRADKQDYRSQVLDRSLLHPGDRSNWILANAYDRRHPTPDRAVFYRTLEWLYPDDSWVEAAAAEALSNMPRAPVANIASMTELMKAFPARHWNSTDAPGDPELMKKTRTQATPWEICAALRQLCETHDFAAAKDLAIRYAYFSSFSESQDLPFWASHLVHKVEACEKAAVRDEK